MMGPEGEQAFIKLARAIGLAQAPMKQLGSFWTKLWTTFGNTIRWQFTTSALRTITGQISTAYRYAQDLDESLTNIRIVTGKSADEMVRFAKEANAAAKNLSTTTTDYTDASLIYYQQGLSDEEVKARTDVTIKLANAAGESAEKASEQLTAIWNNFAEGSENLEYYADVMTALGASTASSTEEISSGLQKFASVAGTVGLSYEYAASAMATITATTRESADVVGTALRTLFARIQGLSQDITQDDGTDLNKYSLALAAVGVQIKDTSGNLRGMDEILNDMAARWKTLSNAQQMALAQTVAGVRQYTQLITLMNNWDFFEKNLQTIEGSMGTLQEQQDTFASGWEASRKRVKAAAEDIYDSIFQPEGFIELNNILSTTLGYVADVVDSLGGLPGIILAIGTLFVNTSQNKIVKSLRELGSWFDYLTGRTAQAQLNFQNYINSQYQLFANSPSTYGPTGEPYKVSTLQVEMNDYLLQTGVLNQLQGKISDNQLQQLQSLKEAVKLMGDFAVEASKAAQEAEVELEKTRELEKTWENINRESKNNTTSSFNISSVEELQKVFNNLNNTKFASRDNIMTKLLLYANRYNQGAPQRIYEESQKLYDYYNFISRSRMDSNNGVDVMGYSVPQIMEMTESYEGLLKVFENGYRKIGELNSFKISLQSLQKMPAGTIDNMEDFRQQIQQVLNLDLKNTPIDEAIKVLDQQLNNLIQNAEYLRNKLKSDHNVTEEQLNKIAGDNVNVGKTSAEASYANGMYQNQIQEYFKNAHIMLDSQQDWAADVAAFSRSIMSLTMAFNQLNSVFQIWTTNSNDLTLGEKLTQTLTSISMIAMSMIPTIRALANARMVYADVVGQEAINEALAKGQKIAMTKTIKDQTVAVMGHTAAVTANPLLMGTIAIGVVLVAISAISAAIKKQTKILEEAAEKSKEYSDSLQEQVQTNKDLIQQMSDALDAYQENADQKDALDDATQALAEAYGIEGAALAKLTGNYDDYLQILLKAKQEKRRAELEEQQRAIVQAGNDQAELINYATNNFFASIKNAFLHPNADFLQGLTNAGIAAQGGNYAVQFSQAERDAINAANSDFVEASQLKTLEDWKNWQDATHNIREDAAELLEEITQEQADALADIVDQSRMIDIALSFEEANVSNIQEYRDLIEDTTNDLEEAGYSTEDISEILNSALNSSLNENILKFREFDSILKDIYNKNPLFNQDSLIEILNSEDFDEAILGLINWATVTEDSFGRVYSAAKQLSEAQMEYNSAKSTFDIADSITKGLKGSDKTLDEDELKTLQGLDWTQLRTDVGSFTEFLQLSLNDQQKFISEIGRDAFQRMVESTNSEIEALESQYEELKAFREFLFTDENQAKIANAETNLNMYNDFVDYVSTAASEGLTWEDPLVQKTLQDYSALLKNLDLSSIKKAFLSNTKEGLQEALDDFKDSSADQVAEWQYWINSIDITEKGLEELDKQIQNRIGTQQIDLKLNIDTNLDKIQSYGDDWLSMYETMSKKGAIQKVVDEMGNSFYELSEDVVLAFEEVYPGFIAGLNVMEDGTFTMTQEMYQHFFDLSQGRISLDTQAAAHAIQTQIAEVDARRAQTKRALEIYNGLLTGEYSIYALTTEQKEILLDAFTNAEKASNGEILDDTVATLEDQRKNWSYLATDIGAYMAEGAENAADAVAQSAADMIEDMKAIQKAAYSAAQQVDNIGSGELKEFKEGFSYVPNVEHNYSDWKEEIDTSNSKQFIDSLTKELFSSSLDEIIGILDAYRDAFGQRLSKEEVMPYLKRLGKEDLEKFFELRGNEYNDISIDEVNSSISSTLSVEAQAKIQEIIKSLEDLDNLDLKERASLEIALERILRGPQEFIDAMNEANDQYDKDNKTSTADSRREDLLTNEDRKDLEDDIERYHRINRLIQDQAEIIEDLNDVEERAYGKKRLEIYRKQIQENEKQLDNYQKKLQRAEWYIEQDKQALIDAFGIDVQFDVNTGEILNYRELVGSLHDEYNSFVDDYNNYITYYNSLTKEQQDAAEEELDVWKQRKKEMDDNYSANLKLIETYESSIDQAQEMRDTIEETQRLIEDNKLKEITYKMDVIVEIKDAKDAADEFSKAIAESFSDALFNQTQGPNGGTGAWSKHLAETEMAMLQHYQEEYAALQQRLAEATDATSIEDIKNEMLELQQAIIDSGQELLEWVESIEEMVPNAVDAARERFDQFLDQLEHNDTILNTIKELYTLQGQTYKTEEGFNRLQSNAQARMDVALAQARSNKLWSEQAEQRLRNAQADFNNLMAEYGGDAIAAENDYRYDTLKKARDAYLQEFNAAQEAMYESAQEAMQIAQDMYLEQIDKAVYDFGQAVSNGIGLDLLQDKYDHYIEEEGRYFDKVNEGYQVSAWYLKLQDDIDKSTNPLMTKRLKALQDEINLRREGNTLSEYDMDILEAKYDMLKAQMELEDAMNAKSELRLVRDRQGNWNYQYTSNPEDIADKQQELLEAENKWYNIAKQQVNDVTQEIIDTWQECQEKIKEVYSDMTLTDQERADRAAEIYDYYAEKIKYLENEKQIAIADMTEAGNKDLFDMAVLLGDEVSDLTGLTSDNIKGIIEQTGLDINGLLLSDWNDIIGMTDTNGNTILDMLTQQSGNIADLMDGNRAQLGLFDNVFAQTVDDMTANADRFDQDLRKALDNAQQHFDDYQAKVEYVAGETGTTLEELDHKQEEVADSTQMIEDRINDLAPRWWEMIDEVDNLKDEFLDLADSIWDVINALEELAHQQAVDVEIEPGLEQNPSESSTETSPSPVTDSEPTLNDMVGDNPSETPSPTTPKSQFSAVSGSTLEDLVTATGIIGEYDNQPVRHDLIASKFPNAYKDGKFDLYYAVQAMVNSLWSYKNGPEWYTKLSELVSAASSATGDALDTVIGTVMADDGSGELIKVTYRRIKELLNGGSFASGGYTGEFNGARLAFLHQKELILNAEDTENMLNAVKTIRTLSPQLLRMIENLLDTTAVSGISSYGSRLGIQMAGMGSPLEQNVHIEAVFPSVTDQYEIVEALNSLVNDASQRINRRTS